MNATERFLRDGEGHFTAGAARLAELDRLIAAGVERPQVRISRRAPDAALFRLCPHCVNVLRRDQFRPNPNTGDGLHPWCRNCDAHDNAARYARRRARVLAARKRVRQADGRFTGESLCA